MTIIYKERKKGINEKIALLIWLYTIIADKILQVIIFDIIFTDTGFGLDMLIGNNYRREPPRLSKTLSEFYPT